MTLAGFEAVAVMGGLGVYFALGAWFEWVYYLRLRGTPEAWKIQPHRFTAPRRRRAEIALGAFNLVMASLLSGFLAYRITHDNPTQVYLGAEQHGIAFGLATTAAYFVGTDLGLYWMHRFMHHPVLFRAIHRWHHRTLSPTAFTAPAMHPLEFLSYQAVAAFPLFLFPIPAWGIVFTLLYHNVVGLFDHSGVDLAAWFPWQPPPRFHDDHHAHFHVNYGQTLGLWDKIFDTWRREGRVYGEHVFGGRGAPHPTTSDNQASRRICYARRATP